MLSELIYHSHFVPGQQGALSVVRHIIETSEINNSRDRITGFLIFDKLNFVQVLEGEQPVVEATYDRIVKDKRHDGLTLIDTRQVNTRAFPDWSMGGFIRSAEVTDIYTRHDLSGQMEPEKLDADKVVALARDLLAFEQARQDQRTINLMSR